MLDLNQFDFSATNIGEFVILLLAVSLHESAHAYVADWLGDPTARRLGRVTLNPVKHLDLIMSVLIPALLVFSNSQFIFGAGRPVPVQPQRLKKPDRDFALVALAGPLSNLLQVLFFSAVYVLLRRAGVLELTDEDRLFRSWLTFGILINLLLAFFNLIPIPPLDGSRFLAYLLPKPVQPFWYSLDRFGFIILIVLFFTHVLQNVLDATYRPTYSWWNTRIAELTEG